MARNRTSFKKPDRQGQAMIEFLIGMVGILFLLMGLSQIARISFASYELNRDVREDMADQLNGSSGQSGDFVYSTGNLQGADGKMYTADDKLMSDSPVSFFNALLQYGGYNGAQTGLSAEEYLQDYGPLSDHYTQLANSGSDLATAFDMNFSSQSVEVDVVPFLRRLLGRNQITLERKVWMPDATGLMQ